MLKTSVYKKLPLFIFLYSAFYLSTYAPKYFEFLHLPIDSDWNWSGKLISLLLIVLFLAFQRNKEAYFLNWKFSFRSTQFMAIAVVFLVFQSWPLMFASISNFKWDTFLFQFFLPPLTEELFYRGILLGILCHQVFKERKEKGVCFFLVSVLFGLGHSLFFTDLWVPQFDSFAFLKTFAYSYFWCWLTYESKTLSYAMVSHMLSNVLVAFLG